MAQGGREPSSIPNATAPSYVYERNGVEILTYETEQDHNKLQDLLKESEAAKPQPGALVHRFYRSRIDGSVQPYMLLAAAGLFPCEDLLAGHSIARHQFQGSAFP